MFHVKLSPVRPGHTFAVVVPCSVDETLGEGGRIQSGGGRREHIWHFCSVPRMPVRRCLITIDEQSPSVLRRCGSADVSRETNLRPHPRMASVDSGIRDGVSEPRSTTPSSRASCVIPAATDSRHVGTGGSGSGPGKSDRYGCPVGVSGGMPDSNRHRGRRPQRTRKPRYCGWRTPKACHH